MLEFEKAIRDSVAAHYWDWAIDPAGFFTDEYVRDSIWLMEPW